MLVLDAGPNCSEELADGGLGTDCQRVEDFTRGQAFGFFALEVKANVQG